LTRISQPKWVGWLAIAAVWMLPGRADADGKRKVEIVPDYPRINRIANPSFEGEFRDGVAEGWTRFAIGRSGYHKENAKLGPIGGGIYGARVMDKKAGDWRGDLMTVRLSGKTNLIDAGRADVIKKLREKLGDDVITILKYGPEDYFSRKGRQVPKGDPVAQGREFADYCYQKMMESGIRASCYYGLNEPHVNSKEDFAKICAFEKAFTEGLHKHGMRSIVINHSTGTPGDRTNMLDGPVRELLAVADYVGYHCYGGPKDELMCAPSSTPNSMRWQTFARWYEERGWRFPPMIYTEATTWGGWHDQFTPEDIRDDLFCMADRIDKEPWSVGMCLFCTACWKGQIWCKWDVTEFPDMVEALREYNLAHPVDAYTGTKSQQVGSVGKPFRRGVCQAFTSRPKSNVHVTCHLKYEYYDGWPCKLELHVGIDETGQIRDPKAKTIEWSDELISTHKWDSDIWYRYSTDFGPTNEQSSIWIRAMQVPGGPSVRVSIDDVTAVETP